MLLSLAGLTFYGRFTTGLNIDILKSITSDNVEAIDYINACGTMSKIYQECNAIDNINITFYIASLLFLVVAASEIYKYRKQKEINQIFMKKNEKSDIRNGMLKNVTSKNE